MRKGKQSKQTIIAICYDFDKTLTPDDMQSQGFIPSLHLDVAEFWKKSNTLAKENGMDQNLAYMYEMIKESVGQQWITRKSLASYGNKIKFFNGVETWFKRINAYAEQKNIKVEHYIISSGLKEMIEGTSIAKEFKEIYACSYYYDSEKKDALWPAQSVNYTNKTQFLFRIEKGLPDVSDTSVNNRFQPDEKRIPFTNMVYIGDSDTDVPCMKIVNEFGGYSIGVYNHDKSKVLAIFRDGRIKLFAPSDYSDGSELDNMIKAIIDKVAASQPIDRYYHKCRLESKDDSRTKEELDKDNLIAYLDDSHNFARTHYLIEKCLNHLDWSNEKIIKLCKIANDNFQVSYLLGDPDVKEFYTRLLDGKDIDDENCKAISKRLKEMKKKG